VNYVQPDSTRASIAAAIDAGFGHIVLGLSVPYPENIAAWVVSELISKYR
jgi:hypothetical protein